MYYYIKNLQGDIVRIVDSSGTMVVNYSYNVWGKLLSVTNSSGSAITDTTHIAYLNPLRYRGYVYDDETGLYYLQSRYYDPTTCRFINADVYCDTLSGSPLSTNMFAYCENCPLLRYDKNGKDAWWIQSPSSASENGHTSLLIEDENNYTWYIFWAGQSIQLLCLGKLNNPQPKKINKYVERFIIVINKVFGYDIDYNENYTDAIRLKGNFINSLSYFSNLMDCIGNVKKLRFNPSISDRDYILLYYKMDDLILEGSDPINALSSSTHQRMYGYSTPQSKVIYFQNELLNFHYHLADNNCLHISAKLLRLGKFSGSEFYDDVMRNVILQEMLGIFTPNFAYEQLNTIIRYSDFGYSKQGLFIAHTFLFSACTLNSNVRIAADNYYTHLLYYILL